MDKELSKIIDKIVREKTLSLEALDAVKQLKKEHARMVDEVDKFRESLHSTEEKLAEKTLEFININSTCQELRFELDQYKAREDEFNKRNVEWKLMEQRMYAAEDKALFVERMTGVMFKNPIYKESHLKHIATPNGYVESRVDEKISSIEQDERNP